LKSNSDILENLHLLGWEGGELNQSLVSSEINQAKIFYTLLLQHKEREMQYQQQQKQKQKSSVLSQSHPLFQQKERSTESKVGPTSPSPSLSVSSASNSSTVSVSSNSVISSPGPSSSSNPSSPAASNAQITDSLSKNFNEIISPSTRARRKSGKEKRVILRKKSGKDNFDRERSSTLGEDERGPNARQTRSATVGDGTRPAVEVRSTANASNRNSNGTIIQASDDSASLRRSLWWLTKPSGDPNSKMYRLESTKNITEILSQLKGCFGDLELDVTEKQTKSGVIKVKASPNNSPQLGSAKKKKPTLKVEMISTEGGNVNIKFKKGQGVDQEDFQEAMKKLEETLSE